MRHMQSSVPVGSAQLISPIVLGEKMTEFDILLLQDAFLCNEVHHIQTKNNLVGRKFIDTFLNALGLSGEIGCLTMENGSLDTNIIDMQEALKVIHPNQSITQDSVEQFFSDHCYFDFIWVELSDTLKSQPWYEAFKENLVQYRHAPIIFLSSSEK